jgi:hypothetical protein
LVYVFFFHGCFVIECPHFWHFQTATSGAFWR